MLKPLAFGLAGGILWGAVLALCVLGTQSFGYPGQDFYPMLAAIYPDFHVSWIGVIVGGIYGFLDGFVFGTVFAWLYNKLAK